MSIKQVLVALILYFLILKHIIMQTKDYDKLYLSAEPINHKIDDASITVRTFGKGKPLVLIHGFVVNGCTWRKIIPELAKQFTCYVVDLPGFGDSQWDKETDFTFTAQSKRLVILFKKLNLSNYSIIAQNTGASISRIVAITEQANIDKLVLINTEIPNHRPPFIPLYQFFAKLPFANLMFRSLIKIDAFVRSPFFIKEFYFDKSKLKDKDNLDRYIIPLKTSKDNMFGMLGYLKGIEWKVIDNFAKSHSEIKAKTLFIWGENDKTFPIEIAKKLPEQFNSNCKLVSISKASLMPHEERPNKVLDLVVPFLIAEQ